MRLLSSLNILGYVKFDVLCNLSTLKKNLCMNLGLPCLSRFIFHAIGQYNCEGEYMVNHLYISKKQHPIQLKQQSFLAMKNDACCYALLSNRALFSFDHKHIALHHAHSFPMMDLRNGCHEIHLDIVMPFGLPAAPFLLMRLMNDVLRDFISNIVVIYFDDILLYLGYLCIVIHASCAACFFPNLDKCTFCTYRVYVLRYVVPS